MTTDSWYATNVLAVMWCVYITTQSISSKAIFVFKNLEPSSVNNEQIGVGMPTGRLMALGMDTA